MLFTLNFPTDLKPPPRLWTNTVDAEHPEILSSDLFFFFFLSFLFEIEGLSFASTMICEALVAHVEWELLFDWRITTHVTVIRTAALVVNR